MIQLHLNAIHNKRINKCSLSTSHVLPEGETIRLYGNKKKE